MSSSRRFKFHNIRYNYYYNIGTYYNAHTTIIQKPGPVKIKYHLNILFENPEHIIR